MAAQQRAAYRSLLREFTRSSITRREQRNRDIAQNVRTLFEEYKSSSEANSQTFRREIGNAVVFLRAARKHKELLDRYNPLHDITQEERVRLTARRVGLDMPIEGKEESEK